MLLFVCLELRYRVVPVLTFLSSRVVDLVTGMRLPVEVILVNVILQSSVLSEGLRTRWEASASKLLSSLVCLLVSAQACRGEKALVTTLPLTRVVADTGVSAFNVVCKVGLAEEVLFTRTVRTSEGPLVGVRADMFF